MRTRISKAAWVRALVLSVLGLNAYSTALAVGCISNADVPGSFATIQAAVYSATSPLTGDHCVTVGNGTYNEQVTFNGINTNGFRINISSDPGANVVIDPPGVSTAAFVINAASVTIYGLKIVPSSSLSYGVLSTSPGTMLYGVTVNGSNRISYAGVELSQNSTIDQSSVSVQAAHGVRLLGDYNSVWKSTVEAAGSSVWGDTLLLINSKYNTINQNVISNQGGRAANLTSGSSFNSINFSTFTNGAGGALGSFHINGSSQNTVSQSFIYNNQQPAYLLGNGATNNSITLSTMATGMSNNSVTFDQASSNSITNSYLPNGIEFLNNNGAYNNIWDNLIFAGNAVAYSAYMTGGHDNLFVRNWMTGGLGVRMLNANSNTISQSTISINTTSSQALYITGASNTVTNSFIGNPLGTAAQLDAAATMNTISFSTMSSSSQTFAALNVNGASYNNFSSNVIISSGSGAQFLANAHNNTISASYIASVGSNRSGVDFFSADLNTLTGSFVTAPLGDGVNSGTGSDFNLISFSTITSNAPNKRGVMYFTGTGNTISQSYVFSGGGYGVDYESNSRFNTISQSSVGTGGASQNALYLQTSSSNTFVESFFFSNTGKAGHMHTGAHSNSISKSTFSTTAGASYALYLYQSTGNSLTQSFFNASNGYGIHLDGACHSNKIIENTINSNTGATMASLFLSQSSSVTVTRNLLTNANGSGLTMVQVSNSVISSNTISNNSGANSAVFIYDSSSNTLTQLRVINTGGHALSLETNSRNNTVSLSSMTSGGGSPFGGLFLNSASSNTITDSYIQGYNGAIVYGSSGALITNSVMMATNTTGRGVLVTGQSRNLSISSSVITGGATGEGIFIDIINSGFISLYGDLIQGSRHAVKISTQSAGTILAVSSITFQGLPPGSTAFEFTSGAFTSIFSGVNFADANIGVNMNAANLSGGVITMCDAMGPRAGPPFENDPGNRIDWNCGGGGPTVFIEGLNLAPAAVGSNATDVPMLRLGFWTQNGGTNLNQMIVSLTGDAPAPNITGRLYKDNDGDKVFQTTNTFIGSMVFAVGSPPQITFYSLNEPLGSTTQYFFLAINVNGVPAGKRIGLMIEEPFDLFLASAAMAPQSYPVGSTQTLVQLVLHARPNDGGYPYPSGATGGLDTGIYLNPNQSVVVAASGTWFVSGSSQVGPGGVSPGVNGGIAGVNLGAVIGRIGSSSWFMVGSSGTFTASNTGTFYLAMNDNDYDNGNAGFLNISVEVLASTVTKVWTGAFDQYADNNSNWLGGKPNSGDRVLFDAAVSSRNCTWNYSTNVSLLTVSTGYTGTITLDQPGSSPVYLTVSSGATINAGTFVLQDNANLEIGGQLIISSATFDLGNEWNHLRVGKAGIIVRGGGTLKSLGWNNVWIEALNSVDRFPIMIEDGTINLNNSVYTQIDATSGLELSSSAIVTNLRRVRFWDFSFNPNAAIALNSIVPITRTFEFIEFNVNYSTNVDADVASGSNITMLSAFGEHMGTPYEEDPNNVVFWSPDGGASAQLHGVLTNSGGGTGNYTIRASTGAYPSPFGGCSGPNTPGASCIEVSSPGTGGYMIPGLGAPNTWYITAWRNNGGFPVDYHPRGGYSVPAGRFRSGPVFLSSGSAPTGINLTLQDWARITGNITNNASQTGQIRVQAWRGDPTLSTSTLEAQLSYTLGTGGGFYDLAVPTTGLWIVGFVDINANGTMESFEASGSSSVVLGVANSVHANADFTIAGGAVAPGGVLSASTASIHGGSIGSSFQQGMLRLDLTGSVSSTTLSNLRFDIDGAPPFMSFAVSLHADSNQNGQFDNSGGLYDSQVGYYNMGGGASSGTINLWQPETILSGQTKRFFLAIDLFNQQNPPIGLSIAASTYFGLSQGEMAPQGIYPIQSGQADVRFKVQADWGAYLPSNGGQYTNFYVPMGLQLTIASSGTWNNNTTPTSPAGIPGTQFQNTIVPSANRGELIARIGSGGSTGSSWFRVGTGTVITSNFSGDLFLAMNDYDGDYWNNSGSVFVNFFVGGSTTGALAGAVSYSGAVNTGNLRLNAVQQYCPTCFANVIATTTLPMSGGTPVAGGKIYNYIMGGLPGGDYIVQGVVENVPGQNGKTFNSVNLVSGSTLTGVNFAIALGTGAISGNLIYTGVNNYGNFIVAAATHTDFSRNPVLFGNLSQPTSGAYTLTGLPTPNTFYIVSFRDGNWNQRPDGPEPFGVHGNSNGAIANLQSLFTPVFVDTNTAVGGKNVTLLDRAAISGNINVSTGLSNVELVVRIGRGSPGSPSYQVENEDSQFVFNLAQNTFQYYNVGLLRGATDYSVLAFADANFNHIQDPGEFFGHAPGPFTVTPGGFTNVDFSLLGPQIPPAPAGFIGTALSTGQIQWQWNASPGASGYQLRTSTGGIVHILGTGAVQYLQPTTPNQLSSIMSIVAVNSIGTSTVVTAPLVASLAFVPGGPSFSGIGESSVTLTWVSSGNATGTVYEISRSTDSVLYLVTSVSSGNPRAETGLAPSTNYTFKIRALNANNIGSGFGVANNMTTSVAVAPSVRGLLQYNGRQSGTTFVQAFTSSSFTGVPAGQTIFPVAPAYNYYVGVPPATYFVRAFIDVNNDGLLNPGEDFGHYQYSTQAANGVVVAGPVAGKDFILPHDTLKPGSPTGLGGATTLGQVSLNWVAPTKNVDNTTMFDLSSYRVQRSTGVSGPFVVISSLTVRGATGTLAGTTFTDFSPVVGYTNYYRVVALDYGQNESQPSGSFALTPAQGGRISGFISYLGSTTDGAFRIRLSSLSAPGAAFLAESTLSTFTFTQLPDGTYFLRGFRDLNGDNNQDSATEPSGTYGGISAPYPIQIYNGNFVSSVTVTICDRTAITIGGTGADGILSSGDCRALDQGPDYFTDVYTFRVGGGGAGSIGTGAQIELRMMGQGYDTRLFLLGPDGYVLAQDQRPGASYINTTVTVPGLYRVEPTSFFSFTTGSYNLRLDVIGGFSGAINGTIAYGGSQPGPVFVQLFNTPDTNAFPVRVSSQAAPGAFSVPGLPDGTYFMRSYRDSNFNAIKDPGEPSGQYGFSVSSLSVISVVGGVANTGALSVTLADPAVGVVAGQILREGTQTGTIRVEIGSRICEGCSELNVVAFTTMSAAGNYELPFISPATNYVLKSYVDQNSNFRDDPLEAKASSSPVSIQANSTTTVNLLVRDPGTGSSGNATIFGAIDYVGTATGPVLMAFATDDKFTYIAYLVSQGSTGAYSKSGVLGGTSYYIAAFIDVNNNGQPDDKTQGEPIGFNGPVFAPASGSIEANITIEDAPTGRIRGRVNYSGFTNGPIIVHAIIQCQSGNCFNADYTTQKAELSRLGGVTEYDFDLPFLAAATNYNVSAFIDSNYNRTQDFGEPSAQFGQSTCSGFGPCFGSPVTVSSGAGSFPTYGVNITINDQGQNTGNFNSGWIKGDVGYLGTLSGPFVVRFFDNSSYSGVPLHTITIAMPPGSGFTNFSKTGLAFGSYWVDAFRDTSGYGVYNPSFHPRTQFGGVTLTQAGSMKNVNGEPMVDLGQGGSLNLYSGNFAAPGGARFDGGATDLGINMAIDTITASGPFIYVQGITHQNGNNIIMSMVKYSSSGVFMTSNTINSGNVARMVVGPSQRLFLGGSTPYQNYTTTAAWYEHNATSLKVISTRTFTDSDVISGMAHFGSSIHALMGCGPHQGRFVRRIDPDTGVVTATGTYIFPGAGSSPDVGCGRALAVNPVTGDVYALVASGGTDTLGKVAVLLRFGPNLDGSGAPIIRDVTNIGLGDVEGSLAVDGAGNVFVAFTNQTPGQAYAKIYKFNSSLTELANTSYPIFAHFDVGLGNLQLGPDGTLFTVFESTMNAGDYLMLRYDQNLALMSMRTFDGNNSAFEDFGASLGVLDASNVFIAGTVNNGQNLDWATIRVNMNTSGGASGAGTTVVITTNTATNAIVAPLRYTGTMVTSGTVRSLLLPAGSNIPVRRSSAPFSTTLQQHIFNSLGGGEYLLQAFIDLNNNLLPEAGEPVFYSASTISYSGAGNLFMPEGQLCDRRPIVEGLEILHSFVAGDCRGPRNAFHRMYTFQGTRGQVVTIEMIATGFYDTFLNLLSPDGLSLIKDDEGAGAGNARISNYVLPVDGLYTIAASPFAAEIIGGFRLSMSGSAGSLGSIAGNISYSGSQGGKVVTGIFSSSTFSPSSLVQSLELTGPGAYSFTNLRTQTTYYIGAFVDVNFNHNPDIGEDQGQFGTPTAAPIELRSGQNLTGLDFSIASSSGAAGVASVSGLISYNGTRAGQVKIEFWSNAAFTGQPVGLRTIPTGVGPYDITVPGGAPYYIRAYLDVNADHLLQLASEPSGVYAPRGQGSEPIYTPFSGSVPGINLDIRDPEQRTVQGGGTSAVGEGRAYVSSAGLTGLFGGSAPIGAGAFASSVTVKVFLGANGMRLGGGVSFGPPQGMFANNVTVTVTSTNTFTTFTENLYPNTILRLMTGDLNAGDTVQFTMHGAFVPCVQNTYPFVIATAQGSGSSTFPVPPAPLFNGSPSLIVQSGAAQFFQFTEGFITLSQNAVSDALAIEAKDNCGNSVPVSGAKNVELRAKTYDFGTGNYVTDGTLSFSTSATGSFATPHTVTIANGDTRGTFFAKATATGFKNIEMFFNLTGPTTFYAGMNVLAGNTLANVSVSTVPFLIGRTSATITPNSDPSTPNQAYINFDLSDTMLSWHLLISSVPYKNGVTPQPLWETWGFGQPSRGQVAWDGRYSPWINFGGRVPSGSYYVRVEVGAGLRDDSLRIDVVSPQLSGTVADANTIPNLPLEGVTVRAFGPFGGGSAQTDSRGAFALPGMSAGVYQLNFEKPNYLFGRGQATINVSGLASTAAVVDSNLTITTTSAGALTVLMSRAPTLVVIPALAVSESTKSFDQWGNVSVHNADYSRFFTSAIRLQAGTTTFDDGGRWDPSVQQFVAKQYLSFDVSIDSYTVEANLVGYDRSTAAVHVPAGVTEVRLSEFSRRRSISGAVKLPSAGLNTFGYFVYINAIPSTATLAASSNTVGEAFGSVFLPPGTSSTTYRIDNVKNGTYALRANAQGLSQVSTGPVVVAGADLANVDLPVFADPTASNIISGTVTINGNTSNFPALGPGQPRMRLHLNAWSPQAANFGNVTVVLSTHASLSQAHFVMLGLSPGVEYQLFGYLEQQGGKEFDSPGGFPKRVTISPALGKNPDGSLQFSFGTSSGVISGTIILPAGSVDFTNVDLYGETIASARPEEVGKTFSVIQSTNLPGFVCGDGNPPSGAGNCGGGVNTATFKVDGMNTQTVDVTLIYRTTGRSFKSRVPVVNGSTSTVTVDLRGSTFTISGAIINQIGSDIFNTNAKIFQNAPFIPIKDGQGFEVPSASSSTARVLAIRQELSDFSAAISTSFKPAVDRVAFLDAAGTFSIQNTPPGVYFLRSADLRSCGTCAILVPRVGMLVRLSTGSIGGVNLTLSDGYSVSGSVSLADDAKDALGVLLSVYNKRQELVRTQTINVGDISEPANSASFTFPNLPSGEFYTLVATVLTGADGLSRYAGRPIRFPNPILSPTGLSAAMTGQDMILQRSAYIVGRLKEANTGTLIGASNASILPPNFEISATANPWVEGGFVLAPSSMSNRPILADSTFRVGPLIPGLYYDLRLQQTGWDLAYLAQGSQNYAPILMAGLIPQAGEVKDVGVLSLRQGQSLSGRITDQATGAGLGNIKVTAKPSFNDTLEVQTFSDPQGGYTIWVSTFVSNQFDITAAPRDGNTASNGKVYRESTFKSVNLVTVSTVDFKLTQLIGSVTGQIRTEDDGELRYPFGQLRDYPAAAIFLQPRGVVPKNPLGDLEQQTNEQGVFEIPGLATGTYSMRAVSLGYIVNEATVTVSPLGGGLSTFCIFIGTETNTCRQTLTLRTGAVVTGRIDKRDPSSDTGFVAPNEEEVGSVAAANASFTKFVIGSVEVDPNARTVNSYTISGFEVGEVYDLFILPKDGNELAFPPEGQDVSFTASESTTTKTINLTYAASGAICTAVQKALGNNQYQIKIDCTKAFRKKTAADDDLSLLLTISTATSKGVSIVSTGQLLGGDKSLSENRRRLTAIYRAGAGEAQFSLRLAGFTGTIDPMTGTEFPVNLIFDFFTGLDAKKSNTVSGITGGCVQLEPSQEDELLGLSESSSICLEGGSIQNTDLTPAATAQLTLQKAKSKTQVEVQYLQKLGYVPLAASIKDNPAAYPKDIYDAMQGMKPLAAAFNPMSAFYDVFLPIGIRNQLKKKANITLSYDLGSASSTTNIQNLNVWHFVNGKWVLESRDRQIDPINKTITVSVDSFSAFVVLASTPVATITGFNGNQIEAYNFPNPADCISHTLTLSTATGVGQGQTIVGTMIRAALPAGQTSNLNIKIFNTAGELVRSMDQGAVAGGLHHYVPWDCKNDGGNTVSSGVYFGQIEWGGSRKLIKMAIIKGSGL